MNNHMSFLDYRAGLRMLSEHPVPTMIGGLAMAVVIAIGAAYVELTHEIWYHSLPLENDDRVVGIMYRVSDDIDQVPLRTFVSMRDELESFEAIGAYREVTRRLFVNDGRPEAIEVARITPSAFRIAGARPFRGRMLKPADMREGAPPVVVLGYDVWQTRLGGDLDVVGRTVRLGDVTATVVGVMPEGFAFPENHNLWAPLGLAAVDGGLGESRLVTIFGRLAPGYSRAEAGREIAAFGFRKGSDSPPADESMRLGVMPYSLAVFEEPMPPGGFLGYAFFAMLMVVVCAAVGALVYRRTLARPGEAIAESALEVSPGRVLTRPFAGMLVLAVLAAALGLVAVYLAKPWGLEHFLRGLEESRPFFWWDRGLAAGTVLYAGLLAILGAAFAGAVPALRMVWRLG